MTLSSTDFNKLNISNKLYVKISLSPCYRFLRRRCNELLRKNMIHNVFCRGSLVAIKLSEQTLQLKIFSRKWYPVLLKQSVWKHCWLIQIGCTNYCLCNGLVWDSYWYPLAIVLFEVRVTCCWPCPRSGTVYNYSFSYRQGSGFIICHFHIFTRVNSVYLFPMH